MSMRAYAAELIRTDSELASLGLTPGGVLAGDVDTPTARPFVNLRWQTTRVGVGNVVVRRFLQIWVHDQPNDYSRIDDILFRLRVLFKEVEGASHGAGHITQVDWLEESQDLVDPGHKTITKYVDYMLVGTEGETSGNDG